MENSLDLSEIVPWECKAGFVCFLICESYQEPLKLLAKIDWSKLSTQTPNQAAGLRLGMLISKDAQDNVYPLYKQMRDTHHYSCAGIQSEKLHNSLYRMF